MSDRKASLVINYSYGRGSDITEANARGITCIMVMMVMCMTGIFVVIKLKRYDNLKEFFMKILKFIHSLLTEME